MKVIHMSDLHVGYENFGDSFRTIIRNLIFEKSDKPKDYVIVITGDLVDDANDRVRYDEVKTGLDSLRQAGFENILVIPGNHDYGTGSDGDKKFVKMFKQSFFGHELDYPKKDIIGNDPFKVAFIGLDSMSEELHWYDELWAEGELGTKQLSKLNQMLRKDDVRSCASRVIYLHHHPFDSWPLHQLKDSDELEKTLIGVINDGISIDAILYGHNHAGKVHNGHWGIPRCYDAGTATLKRSKFMDWLPWFEEKSAIRIIDLANSKPPFNDYIPSLL